MIKIQSLSLVICFLQQGHTSKAPQRMSPTGDQVSVYLSLRGTFLIQAPTGPNMNDSARSPQNRLGDCGPLDQSVFLQLTEKQTWPLDCAELESTAWQKLSVFKWIREMMAYKEKWWSAYKIKCQSTLATWKGQALEVNIQKREKWKSFNYSFMKWTRFT